MKVKYGFDGTKAPKYKQKFTEDGRDDNIFCTSLVPLALTVVVGTGKKLWTNPRPSSVRLCRPIKIEFIKETKEVCKAEEKNLKDQIAKLLPCEAAGCKTFFDLSLTMIDGKVI